MVATAVASYFLLTGDYGPEPNVLDPYLSSSMILLLVEVLVIRMFSYWWVMLHLFMLVIEHWIKRKILAAQDSVKQFIFGPKGEPSGKEPSDTAK
ncbi:hypothetical protein [Arabidopsis thaliana]|uniref:F6N23.20 protein n=1 Tax=Arabidopsis thaliana TaxID=3702 RepID=O65262_ARATH|nr:F6N23.20 gene product [Arabidopsis thaliana]CAB80862.1 hypothetical protein [Arabidopsis thaliana]